MSEEDVVEPEQTNLEDVTPQEDVPESIPERDYEAEAREQGWRPKEEFHGPETQWKDAETFVRDGERFAKIANSRADQFKTELDSVKEQMRRMAAMNEKSMEAQRKQYEAQMQQIKAAKLQAVEQGNTEWYNQLEEVEGGLSAPDSAPKQPDANEASAIYNKWVEENDWYIIDPELNGVALRYSQSLGPNVGLEDNLKLTSEFIRTKFPDKFPASGVNGSKRPAPRAMVDGGSSAVPSRSREKGYSDLPQEAKQQYERDVRQGVYKDTPEDRTKWAKDYWSL